MDDSDEKDRRREEQRGRITLICGCMFSGKTTELLQRLAGCPNHSFAVFKNIIDDRYEREAVVSHPGGSVPATKIGSASEIYTLIDASIRTVAVDEGHFFNHTLIEVAQDLAKQGLTVLITALDRDSWGSPFAVIQQLRFVADETVVKHALCARCKAPADHTQRTTPIINGRMVGGAEAYEPRCAACWHPPHEERRPGE